MTTENIDIRVSEDGSRVVRRRLDDIADGAEKAQSAVDRMNSVLKTIAKFLAVGEVMKWADAWSVAASSIKIATKNSYEFVQVQTELFKIAQRSRQEFGAMAELYAAVARQSENLKTSQKGLLLYTENIAKALAIQHTSMQAARGPLLQLGQAMASGNIRAQEFNSIMLGLPYVMKVVAENFKGGAVSVMQLRQMMLQGKLQSIEFYEAFQRGSAQINDDFKKTQVTFSQAFTIFKNELIKFTGTMDSTTGASAKFASVMKFVADNLVLLAGALAALTVGTKLGPIIDRFIAMRAESSAAAAAIVAANTQMAASEAATTAAALVAAKASATKTEAELANVRATQAGIVIAREAAIATLAKANSDVIASRAAIQAATNAGALSFALAVKRDAEVSLTAAEVRRSAALSELAILGQQQARVTVIQTEATAAHAAAVRALSVAQGIGAEAAAAYGIAQSGAAAATARVGVAAGAAALGTRLFSGAVALMGGPIGVAITALIGLGMWLFNIKSKADDARQAIEAVNRVNAAKTGGPGVRQSDAEKIQSAQNLAQKNLEDAQDKLDALNRNIAAKRAAGNAGAAEALERQYAPALRQAIVQTTAEVEKFSKAMEDAKTYSAETGGAAGAAAREVSQARGAWESSIGSVKTATTVQEAYNTELTNSRAKHKAYIEQLQKHNDGGVNSDEIQKAIALQGEVEKQMVKNRNAALKALAAKGADEKVQVKLDADERMSVIQNALDLEVGARKQAYEAEKRMLDSKHQNGVVTEAQFMAQNLQMVQRYDQEERAIIQSGLDKYKEAYTQRRAYIQKMLSGQRESDELTKLDADYSKFVASVNSKLSRLDTSAFERQSVVIDKLSGDIGKLAKQDNNYWRQADANVAKEQKMASARLALAFATEEQQAAYEAYVKTGEQHNAQLDRLQDAYELATRDAEEFSAAIDWSTAGTETMAVLDAMVKKAEEFGKRLGGAYAKLDDLRNRAAEAAAESVRNKAFNKDVSSVADAIETAIFEGGKAGGKKAADWLKDHFLRNPLRVILQGTVSTIMSGMATQAAASAGGSVLSGIGSSAVGSMLFGGTSLASVGTSIGAGFMATLNGSTIAGGGAAALLQGGSAAMGMLGAAMPYLLPPIALAASWKKLFGRELKDQGIEGTFGGEQGFQGNSYKFYEGGLFRSDKTEITALEESVRRGLAESFTSLKKSVEGMAETLGIGATGIEGFTSSIKLSLTGLNEEQSKAKIEEALNNVSNDLAEQILGSWEHQMAEVTQRVQSSSDSMLAGADAYEDVTSVVELHTYKTSQYAKEGERAIDTLTRLAVSFSTVNDASDALGYGFQTASLAAANAASNIIDAFGGLEAFTETMGAYMTNFYSTEEQRAATARAVARSLSQSGLDVSADTLLNITRPQIRAFVESIGQQFGVESEQYVSAVQHANTLATITEPLEQASSAAQTLDRSADEATRAAEEALRAWNAITNALLDEQVQLKIDMLRAQGREEEAIAAERLRAIEGYDAYQIALYDSNTALRAQITELERLAEVSRTLAEELPAVIDKYRTPEQQAANQYTNIASSLISAGVPGAGTDVDALANVMMSASKDDIAKAVMSIYNLTGVTDEMRLAIVRAAGSLADLKDASDEIVNANKMKSLDAAWKALERSVNAQKSILQDTIREIRSVFNAATSAAKTFYTQVDSGSAMLGAEGRSFLDNALSNARATGYLPDADDLQNAIGAITTDVGAQVYATQFEADRDRLVLAGKFAELSEISGEQLSEAERQLEALETLLEVQRVAMETAKKTLDATYEGTAATLSVGTALSQWMTVLTSLLTQTGGAGGGGATLPGTTPNKTSTYIEGLNGAGYDVSQDMGYQAGTGLPWMGSVIRQEAAAMVEAGNAMGVYDIVKSQGFTLADADRIFQLPEGSAEAWAKSMGIPVFHQGTDYVPRTGLALLQQGEAVTSRARNLRNNMGSSLDYNEDGDFDMLTELRAIRANSESMEARLGNIEKTNARMSEQQTEYTENGNAARVEIMNVAALAKALAP